MQVWASQAKLTEMKSRTDETGSFHHLQERMAYSGIWQNAGVRVFVMPREIATRSNFPTVILETQAPHLGSS